MRTFIANAIAALLTPRTKAASVPIPNTAGSTGTYDTYRRKREPSAAELIRELRNTAYTCASINAATCAKYAPKLYVLTHTGQPMPKCRTKPIADPKLYKSLCHRLKAEDVAEVVEHPLITILNRANPVHSGFDLLELTTLHQEACGRAHWYVDLDDLDTPSAIWPLLPTLLRPYRAPQSRNIVDYYEYLASSQTIKLDPARVITFRYPDAINPFYGGVGPIRGAIDNIVLDGTFLAFKQAVWENAGLPSAIVSPKNGLSPTERERLEEDWARKFTRGGQGKILVPDDEVDVHVLTQKLADFAALAEQKATKEQIANAHGVPLSFLTTDTNLANLEAAERQHASLALRPRLARRDATLNEQLVPFYDPTRRLYLESDDPVLASLDFNLRQEDQHLARGVRTINEVRGDHGWDPVPWGDEPWLPLTSAQTSFDRRNATIYAPQIGRNKPEQPGEMS